EVVRAAAWPVFLAQAPGTISFAVGVPSRYVARVAGAACCGDVVPVCLIRQNKFLLSSSRSRLPHPVGGLSSFTRPCREMNRLILEVVLSPHHTLCMFGSDEAAFSALLAPYPPILSSTSTLELKWP
ncbi:unnamed protein product, partial [Ectocarpus sp. 12 AP-2014]